MWKRTMKFAEWQTPEQRKAQVTMWQRHDAQQLTMCNGLQFWRICRDSECKRRHACSGDPHACFTRHWATVPEDEKNWLRAGIKARADGLSPEAAARAADAEMARHAAAAAPDQAPAADTVTTPQRDDAGTPTMPRVRGL